MFVVQDMLYNILGTMYNILHQIHIWLWNARKYMTWPPGRQSWSEAQPWTPSPHSDPGTRWGLLYYIWNVLSWGSLSFRRLFFKSLFPFLGPWGGPLELLLVSVPPPVSLQEKTKSFVLPYKSPKEPPTISMRPPRCPPWPPSTTKHPPWPLGPIRSPLLPQRIYQMS